MMSQLSSLKPWLRGSIVLLLLALAVIIPNGVAAQPSAVYEPNLRLGWVVKGDIDLNTVLTYTVVVPSGKQIIVGAINVDAIQVPAGAAAPPEVAVTCPMLSTTQTITAQNSQAIYCRPASSTGSDVTVTISLKGTSRSESAVSYALFVHRLDSSIATTFDSLLFENLYSAPRHIQTFFMSNSDNSLTQRNLVFTPSLSYRAAALLYRSDGSLMCGTLAPQTCQTYDQNGDYFDYYLVVLNTGDISYTYGVDFVQP
ncbi:hypothetical protein [Candidatus Oscillochloris fontis]|uniref:hypothetical protein n=1 Tax=Candidatus Oscillochloris fontis TaxID=2496868 RepID=UPI00101E0507|nr:hypothetical protein [Candidatus Oscillochloris fontis]